ncbi:MAG: NADH-quinone oxidoreductase subunit NuoK [Chloroflexi bacterium]|nr:NADH-quinone oxidoreductase subunit NuoK [Chloroflexota bacterium]MCH8101996.1 NADH-quinone oxidoreductase subunit NuoK [Chloroflexota bacterium]
MLELVHFQILSAALFSIGIFGVLARRSAVLVLISVELMLNAVNINLIGVAAFSDRPADERVFGQILVVFIITIAAAEIGLALAIVLRVFRNRGSANVDDLDLMKW